MPKIKIDAADKWFSLYIRERAGWICERCHKPSDSLQCSHFYGRASESTRFDPDNADCLDYGCHQYWGSTNHEDYRTFKIKKLGEKGFKLLTLRNAQYKKKDRKMEAIIWKAAYLDLCKSKGVTPKK